jgi:hypothetical protein
MHLFALAVIRMLILNQYFPHGAVDFYLYSRVAIQLEAAERPGDRD